MNKILTIFVFLISNSSFSQKATLPIVFIKNMSDIKKNERVSYFFEKTFIDTTNVIFSSINEIVFLTDSLEKEGYNIRITNRKFYGNSINSYKSVVKKVELNKNSIKKLNKFYVFSYFLDDLVAFYIIE